MADSANVFIASPPVAAGTFHRAVLGTTLPVDASTALEEVVADLYKDLGYVGEEGYTVSIARDVKDLKAFGGNTVATTQDSYDWSVKVPLIEDGNLEVLKTIYGDSNVTVAGALKVIKHNKIRLPRQVFVVDVVGDNEMLKRLAIPIGQVVSIDDYTLVHTDMVKYTATIKAYPDATGNNVYEYQEDASGS